ncbi:DUF4192 domain-containing protein [Gordonia polyisoprenivorans]|uniref:DUF4192 domain-containing protein n=1 Tax=Gordonia polyisoprenivorans TaxID=84595 RepID=UPI001B8C7659|nr:DUF4192 domain-containing protein [Gordonia polyisoprenivorans]QUD85314.1 DUF4192 domain-containing protein [Gordonia polyisoprenivorans]UZF58620.1 DUF4192 domain-containing protein [Gordonia polyisoprenivorans]
MTPQIPPSPIDATTLLSAVPALLGFIPSRSLIVVVLQSPNSVRVAMRYDLSLTPDGRATDELLVVAERFGHIVRRHGGGPVLAVIADDRYSPHDDRYRQVFSLADDCLADSGGLAQGFVVTAFERHAPWQLIWRRCAGPTAAGVGGRPASGTMADPYTSPTAVAEAVSTGRRILGDRSEMAAMLTPLPHCDSTHCDSPSGDFPSGAEFDGGQRVSTRTELRLAPVQDDLSNRPAAMGRKSRDGRNAELLRAVLHAMQAPGVPDCATMTVLHRAITTLPVRDAALACAVTDLRSDAENLWRTLTRRLRGTGRASAATLLAHLHYIGGEGAFAGVALDCALAADPGWKLATLLDQALRGGATPSLLWEMIDESYGIATDLGVVIPRATLRAVG